MEKYILLVEDDATITKGITYLLEQNGFKVISKDNFEKAVETLKKIKLDLIILDVSLPDGDGFTLYKEYIKKTKTPTIFLTARDEEDDIVQGLELGAEEYITKPFFNRELLTRINKIISQKQNNNIIQVKDIKFDIDKMVVYKNGTELNFTSLELKILNLLFTNINKVVSREDIIEKIWQWTGNDVNDNTVTVYLKRIRDKIVSNIIITIKGIGYRIDKEE